MSSDTLLPSQLDGEGEALLKALASARVVVATLAHEPSCALMRGGSACTCHPTLRIEPRNGGQSDGVR